VGCLDHIEALFLIFWRNICVDFHRDLKVCFPPTVYKGLFSQNPSIFLDDSNCGGRGRIQNVDLTYVSLVAKVVE
jgi:hypothetical protein